MRDEQGETIESSVDAHPTAVLIGHQNAICGVEEALVGRSEGESFTVEVPPDEAYGEIPADWTQRVSKKYFNQPKRLRPGMITQLSTDKGTRSVQVIKVGNKVADVDLNHPLAGKTLTFDIEVLLVRPATPE